MFRRGKIKAISSTTNAIGEEAKILCRSDRRLRHEPDRLTGVETLQYRNFLGVRLDHVRDLVQQRLTLVRIEVAPILEGAFCRLSSALDVTFVATRYFCDDRVIYG